MTPATLDLLIERAKEKCDTAQLRLANLQRLVEQAQTHLQLLQRYTREYEEGAAYSPDKLLDTGARQNQMHFLARLQQAVDTQVRELDLRRNHAAAAGTELAHCRKKHKSLETLRLRQIETERRAQARRDQKNTDEFAQRAHERTARAHRQENESPATRSHE